MGRLETAAAIELADGARCRLVACRGWEGAERRGRLQVRVVVRLRCVCERQSRWVLLNKRRDSCPVSAGRQQERGW
jgi:hypothetical protein